MAIDVRYAVSSNVIHPAGDRQWVFISLCMLSKRQITVILTSTSTSECDWASVCKGVSKDCWCTRSGVRGSLPKGVPRNMNFVGAMRAYTNGYGWQSTVITEIIKAIKSVINICVTQGVGKNIKHSRGAIKGRVAIENRPEIVAQRLV